MDQHSCENRNLIIGHLMDQADIGYIEIDRNFFITLWSRGAETLLGRTAGATLGMRLDEVLAMDEKALSENETTGDVRIFHLDRHNRPLQYQVHFISIIDTRGEKGGTALLVKEIFDVREECHQSSLRAGGDSMAEILGFAPVGIFHGDLNGNLVMANSEYAWMLGYESPDHLVQQVNDFAGQVFYDEKKAEEFMFLLMEAERVARFRCRLRRRDGSFIWVLCFAMITFDPSGRADGFNGYAIDIGETVKAETALQKANEELMRLSVIDGLTQIANRRQFDAHLDMEWKGHLKAKAPLSVILCDIDYFKNYNDTYGHQAGDECLKRVAGAIDNCARRAGGLAARYGGEEFGIILSKTHKAAAADVAENIRTRVQGLGIEHESSQANDHVTLSLGVATVTPRSEPLDTGLLGRADAALYVAKEQGRNQCVSG